MPNRKKEEILRNGIDFLSRKNIITYNKAKDTYRVEKWFIERIKFATMTVTDPNGKIHDIWIQALSYAIIEAYNPEPVDEEKLLDSVRTLSAILGGAPE